MGRNFGTGVLIFCFGLSNVNAGLASQVLDIPPIVVQPYEMQGVTQQVIERGRQNQDEEIEIKKLIEENNKLTQATLARQEDDGLAKINQTMLSYRDTLLSRDRVHIVANGEKWWSSRYGDLVALTENVDDMKDIHQDLENKSGLLAEKYQMLTDLKDEMTDLNDKLSAQGADALNQKQKAIEGYKKIAREQQDKIQMLVDRLGEMDRKISHFDEIIAQKDQQIERLKDTLARMKSESADKDETIEEQKTQIAVLQGAAKSSPSSVSAAAPIVVNAPSSNREGKALADQLAQVQSEIASKDEIISRQKDQIDNLKNTFKDISSNKGQVSQLGLQLSQKQDQVDLLKSELENKITEQSQKQGQVDLLKSELENKITEGKNQNREVSAKDSIIKQQEDQIAILKAQSQELSSKSKFIQSQSDQMARASEQFKDQGARYASVQAEIMDLRNKMHQQNLDLKAKDDSIRWLNQVLTMTKDKAQYYKLTSQQGQLSLKQVQGEVQGIKDDFAQHFKNYDQFENTIASLKDQVSQLGLQLSQKNIESQQEAQLQQDLKIQLQDKDDQIVKMKADIQEILQAQADKEIYRRKALVVQVDDRVKLAKELINLQQQETALLEEKSELALQQYDIFDRHFAVFENRMKILLSNHQIQTTDFLNHMEEVKSELYQNQQQIKLLNTELRNKISQEINQNVLTRQIQDLQAQLQDKENQITTMKTQIQSGQETQAQADTLKQQLADQQNKMDLLKQELDSKNAESNKMTLLIDDYQKKLESKDNAYNEQLGQVLSFKNYQAQMEKQIADLNVRLQEKEAQVVKIKKDMYDLQELTSTKDRDAQSKDLSLSIMQQKTMDDKINEYKDKIKGLQADSSGQAEEMKDLKTELALARQELNGMPSVDELAFLRTGLEKATVQLKQKDAMIFRIKTNADEYAKEYKEQSLQFKSLKDQLQSAYEEINHRNEDLKYKKLEVIRLKERSAIKEGDLQDQVTVLTRKLEVAEKRLMSKTHENKVEALQAQLKRADMQIKDLQAQLDRYTSPSKNDPEAEKLKQALDKINQQGQLINVLAQKLQDAGKTVDLTR